MKKDLFSEWFGTPRKGGYVWKDSMSMDGGSDFGGGLEKYMRGVPDIGSDFGNYLSDFGKFNAKEGNVLNMGLSNKILDIGGDYMNYVSKAGQIKTDDFMSYLEAGSPKAFRTIGKEPKSITKRRFADKDMELEYGAESIGFATEGLERNIHKSAKSTLKRAQRSKAEISSGYSSFRKNVKEGRGGFDEGTVGAQIVKKVKDYKARRDAIKEVDRFIKEDSSPAVYEVRKEGEKQKIYKYTKAGTGIRREELE